jgi:glutathione S-transferase
MFDNRVFIRQEPKEQQVKDLKVRLGRVLGLLDRKLSDRPFMAGEVSGDAF